VFDAAGLIAAQALVRRMPVGESIVDAILTLVRAARPGTEEANPLVAEDIAWGPGPRAAQSMMLAVRARALMDGRLAPTIDDVVALSHPILIHRMALTFGARAAGRTLDGVITSLVEATLSPSLAA